MIAHCVAGLLSIASCVDPSAAGRQLVRDAIAIEFYAIAHVRPAGIVYRAQRSGYICGVVFDDSIHETRFVAPIDAHGAMGALIVDGDDGFGRLWMGACREIFSTR